MNKIIQLYSDKNKTIKAYPKTLASQVYMDDGQTTITSQLESIALNIKSLGVKGDGVTDDTVLIQKVFNDNTKKTIYFPDGVYCISAKLLMNTDCSLRFSKNAEIKAIATMDYMFELNNIERVGHSNMTFKDFIEGGIFNANYKATNIIIMSYFIGYTIKDTQFLNFSGVGLTTRKNAPSNELIADNLYFKNDKSVKGSLAILNNGRDNEFSKIIIRDIHKGIDSYDSRFSHIHGWIGYSDLLQDSYFFKSLDGYCQLNQVYADTYQYPFISCFGTLIVNNSMCLWNKDIYTEAIQTQYPICVFKADNTPQAQTTYGTFNVSNTSIHCSLPNTLLTNKYAKLNVFSDNYIRAVMSGNIDYTNFSNLNENIQGGYIGNVDDITEVGAYSISNASGLPSGAYAYGQLIMNVSSTLKGVSNYQYKSQMYIPSNNSNRVYIRYWTNGGWSNWTTLDNIVANETITNMNLPIHSTPVYGTMRLFIPLDKANIKTITLTKLECMLNNTTTNITGSCNITAKLGNGFIVQSSDVSCLGGVAVISFTATI